MSLSESDKPPSFFDIAMGHARRKAYDDAIVAFDRHIDLNPNHDRSFYFRGIAWHDKGNPLRAIDDFDKALQLNPNYRKARQSRKEAIEDLGFDPVQPLSPGRAFVREAVANVSSETDFNVLKRIGIGLFTGLLVYWILSWNQGFSSNGIAAIEDSIRAEFSKRKGIVVDEVKMIKETNTKLTGYVKIRIEGLNFPIAKSCRATYGKDSQTIWECQ